MPATDSTSVHAVVFDLDGVLVDSETIWDEIRRELAAEAGRPWPDGATRAIQGMSTPEWSGYLHDTVGVPGSAEEIARTVIGRLTARYRERLPLIDGAVAAVTRLADRWPLGLASSSPRTLIAAVLDTSGLASAFRVAVSTEEVPAGKPAPDVYLTVAARLGVRARPRRGRRGFLQRAASGRRGRAHRHRHSARGLSARPGRARAGRRGAVRPRGTHARSGDRRRHAERDSDAAGPHPSVILDLSAPQKL